MGEVSSAWERELGGAVGSKEMDLWRGIYGEREVTSKRYLGSGI